MKGSRVNRIDVQAIGWIVTRDLCSEGARAYCGLKPRLEKATLQELGRRWLNVGAAVKDDQMTMSLVTRIMCPRRAPLSKKSEEAMKAFLGKLVACSPGLYGHQALRGRCLGGCVHVMASFLCCLMVGHYASPESPMLGWASLGFFIMGCWSLAVAYQLFVACRLIGRLGAEHVPRGEETATE